MKSQITLAAILLLSGTALAQPTPPAASTAVPTAMQPGQIRAEQLVGKDVFDAGNQEIGEIEDLVIDRRSGNVAAVLIEIESTQGVPERHIAVPFARVQIGANDRLTLDASADEIKAMPSYAYERRRR